MKTLCIPSCKKKNTTVSKRKHACTRRGRDSAPIFERRLISSALRLKNPAGFAAMHRAVGIIFKQHVFLVLLLPVSVQKVARVKLGCGMMSLLPCLAAFGPAGSSDRRSVGDKIDKAGLRLWRGDVKQRRTRHLQLQPWRGYFSQHL